MPTDEFVQQLSDAYTHLYDIVYLRTHPLLDVLAPDAMRSRKERAWQMHHLLLKVIEELRPQTQAATFSRQWRRHRLMVLRYVKALEPQVVADELNISRRHFYREHSVILETLAGILWNRHASRASQQTQPPAALPAENTLSHLELLRLEAARMAQTHRYAQIGRVVATVLPLLSSLLGQHDLETELAIEDPLPSIATEQHVLKQVLLGILSYLIEHSQGAILRLSAHQSGEVMCLCAQVDPPGAIRPASPTEVQERLEAFSAMATLSGAEIQPLHSGQALVGFEMHFPIAQDTVLVVDDNADVLMLFQRYLEEQHYHVVTTQTAQEVSRLALQLQPRAITLDLMMPGQDGWELLQTLLHQPGTRHIPIVVCSVLKQKELALSLGATAFLEKPVTKQALLSVFNSLGKQSP